MRFLNILSMSVALWIGAHAEKVCETIINRNCGAANTSIALGSDDSEFGCQSKCYEQGEDACAYFIGGEGCKAIDNGITHVKIGALGYCIVCSEPINDDFAVRIHEDWETKVQLPAQNFGSLSSWTFSMHVKVRDWDNNGDRGYGRIFDFGHTTRPMGGDNILLFQLAGKMGVHFYKDGTNFFGPRFSPTPALGEYIWVTVSYHDISGIYRVFFDNKLVSSSPSGTPKLRDVQLNSMLVGRSHWSNDPYTDIDINYYWLDPTNAVEDDIEAEFMNKARGGANASVKLDYNGLAQLATGNALLLCTGDYYSENKFCLPCDSACEDQFFEASQCTWQTNRACAPCAAVDNCARVSCSSADDSVCVTCEAGYDITNDGRCLPNYFESLVGLQCGELNFEVQNFWTMIEGRPHVDFEANVVQFKVGGVKSKGLNVALVDKDSINNPLAGVELFIGAKDEPVIHISESLGAEPVKFVDISASPVFPAQDNVLADAWIKVEGDTVSVGTGKVGESSEKELISYTLTNSVTINRAILSYGYGDLECKPFENFYMNVNAEGKTFESVPGAMVDPDYVIYTNRDGQNGNVGPYTWVRSMVPDYMNDATIVGLKSVIRFEAQEEINIQGFGILYYVSPCHEHDQGYYCATADQQLEALGFRLRDERMQVKGNGSNNAKNSIYSKILHGDSFTIKNVNTNTDENSDLVTALYWKPTLDPTKE